MLEELKKLSDDAKIKWENDFIENIPNVLRNAAGNKKNSIVIWNIYPFDIKVGYGKVKPGLWNKLFNVCEEYPIISGFSKRVWDKCVELELNPIFCGEIWEGLNYDNPRYIRPIIKVSW